MKQIIGVHGWCSDQNNWVEWKKFFHSNGWHWESFERGYGETFPIEPIWSNQVEDREQKRILICHSLGTHLISSKILQAATDIILINSFAKFIPDKKDRVINAALAGMTRGFKQGDPSTILKDFLTKAFKPYSIPISNQKLVKQDKNSKGYKRLRTDLELLIKTQGLPSGFPKEANVLVISGELDTIVESSAKEELLQALKLHLTHPPLHRIMEGEGHFILLPDLVNHVKDWLEQ